ncbi:hypothetical protein ABTX81_00755 [Kitasatospora sp. NPDC097605]|uniref:hypothetical protein n=1 Tax=Kitasatospora sp. NPDC097605 TaxID=3157226 RepID=UPI00332CD9F6
MHRNTTALAAVLLALPAGFLTGTALPTPAPASPAATSTPAPVSAVCAAQGTPISEASGRAITAACGQVATSTWYTWGGGHGPTPGATYGSVDPSDPERSKNDPYPIGFDCSDFVRRAWSQAVGTTPSGRRTPPRSSRCRAGGSAPTPARCAPGDTPAPCASPPPTTAGLPPPCTRPGVRG